MAAITHLLAAVAPIRLLAAAGIVVGAGLACGGGSVELSPEVGQSTSSVPTDEPTLTEADQGTLSVPTGGPTFEPGSLGNLRDIEELQALFNQDTGVTRLLLLLSPT